MTIAAIIFDYDGVIADSEAGSNASFSRVMTAAGMPTSIDDVYDHYLGHNWSDTLAAMTARWGAVVPHDIYERIWTDYHAETGGRPIAVPGVIAFIGAIGHVPGAVASSSPSDYIRAGLGALGIARHFGDHIYSGGEHVTRGKPFPDLYLHAAYALGVGPAQTLVIEDSPIGARAAVAAGARVVGLAAGSHARPALTLALEAEGVEQVFTSYADLATHLGLTLAP